MYCGDLLRVLVLVCDRRGALNGWGGDQDLDIVAQVPGVSLNAGNRGETRDFLRTGNRVEDVFLELAPSDFVGFSRALEADRLVEMRRPDAGAGGDDNGRTSVETVHTGVEGFVSKWPVLRNRVWVRVGGAKEITLHVTVFEHVQDPCCRVLSVARVRERAFDEVGETS